MTEGIRIEQDRWLSDVLGYPAWRVVFCSGDGGALTVHVREQREAFYYAKIDAIDLATVHALERTHCHVVDVNVTFERNAQEQPAMHADGVTVVLAAAEHAERVLGIAASAFTYSRFHLDPAFNSTVADKIKRCWLESYLAGRRGDQLFVATRGDTTVGWLAALRGDEAAVIDLIAVRADDRRSGVGAALVRAFVRHYGSDCPRLRAGTQIANVPSIRLYQKLGFRLVRSQFVLHLHVREGKAIC